MVHDHVVLFFSPLDLGLVRTDVRSIQGEPRGASVFLSRAVIEHVVPFPAGSESSIAVLARLPSPDFGTVDAIAFAGRDGALLTGPTPLEVESDSTREGGIGVAQEAVALVYRRDGAAELMRFSGSALDPSDPVPVELPPTCFPSPIRSIDRWLVSCLYSSTSRELLWRTIDVPDSATEADIHTHNLSRLFGHVDGSREAAWDVRQSSRLDAASQEVLLAATAWMAGRQNIILYRSGGPDVLMQQIGIVPDHAYVSDIDLETSSDGSVIAYTTRTGRGDPARVYVLTLDTLDRPVDRWELETVSSMPTTHIDANLTETFVGVQVGLSSDARYFAACHSLSR